MSNLRYKIEKFAPAAAIRPVGAPATRPAAWCARLLACPVLWTVLWLMLSATPALAELQLLYYPDNSVKARFNTVATKKGEVLRHGGFQRFYPSGLQNVQGKYRFNRRVGVWSWWNEEGILVRRVRYDGNFQELLFGSQFNSPETVFSNPAKRKIARGLLKHDKGHGEWRYWYDTGELKAKGRFVTGRPDGRWVMFYVDGQIKSVKEYQLGILHGQFMQAFPSGQEKIKGRMELGMKVGQWRYWYKNGQIKSDGHYLNDREDGKWRFWAEDGELKATVIYRAGKSVKVLPMAPRPSGKPEGDPVIPLPDQKLEVNPGIYDGEHRPIRKKYYDAKATPPIEKYRRRRQFRR